MINLFFHTFFIKFIPTIVWDFKKLDLFCPLFLKKQVLHHETYKNIFLISTFILTILNETLLARLHLKYPARWRRDKAPYIKGNHLHNWHDYNGWTAVQNSDGWWVYALENNGKTLIPSQIKVGMTDNPVINPSIVKGIKPDPHQLIDNSPIPTCN